MKITKLINHGKMDDKYYRLDGRCEDDQQRYTIRGAYVDGAEEIDLIANKKFDWTYDARVYCEWKGGYVWDACVQF